MSNCQAQSTRYVGKGKGRVAHSGPCVLELGHDLDHLPASLAVEQQYNQAFNAGVTEALALVAYRLGLHGAETADLANEIIPEVERIKR